MKSIIDFVKRMWTILKPIVCLTKAEQEVLKKVIERTELDVYTKTNKRYKQVDPFTTSERQILTSIKDKINGKRKA